MADDSLAALSALATALPVPATTLATLDAATLAPAELAAALRFAAAAKAANTRRAYAADWADFCRWAALRGVSPHPCPPGYLAALADAWPARVHHHPPCRGDCPAPRCRGESDEFTSDRMRSHASSITGA
jgi:hypothetical protein